MTKWGVGGVGVVVEEGGGVDEEENYGGWKDSGK